MKTFPILKGTSKKIIYYITSITLYYKDGSSKSFEAPFSSSFGMTEGETGKWTVDFDTCAVIEPENVEAIEINNHKIELSSQK